MSWMFKNPSHVLIKDLVVSWKKSYPDCLRIQLTVAWLNLAIPNQTVKNGLKAKKIKLPQMNCFLK